MLHADIYFTSLDRTEIFSPLNGTWQTGLRYMITEAFT